MERDEKSTENLALTKIIIPLIGKTLLVIATIGGFLMVCMASFFPANLASFAESMNLVKVRAVMLEKVCNKSNSLADLNRAIEADIVAERYSEAVGLINRMQKSANYADFVVQMNESSIRQTKKENLVFVLNYDAFLNTQKVVCLYKSNQKSKAQKIALQALEENSNIYSWEFGTYIDCLLADGQMATQSKVSTLGSLYDDTLKTQINDNLSALGDESTKTGLVKLETIYTKIKINTTLYQLKKLFNENLDEVEQVIDDLIESYNQTLATIEI